MKRDWQTVSWPPRGRPRRNHTANLLVMSHLSGAGKRSTQGQGLSSGLVTLWAPEWTSERQKRDLREEDFLVLILLWIHRHDPWQASFLKNVLICKTSKTLMIAIPIPCPSSRSLPKLNSVTPTYLPQPFLMTPSPGFIKVFPGQIREGRNGLWHPERRRWVHLLSGDDVMAQRHHGSDLSQLGKLSKAELL